MARLNMKDIVKQAVDNLEVLGYVFKSRTDDFTNIGSDVQLTKEGMVYATELVVLQLLGNKVVKDSLAEMETPKTLH